jgi:hypothetical protein
MDSQTHVEFAAKLLKISNAPSNLALISLFPQIDRYPHTLHRMYAHTVFKARIVTETGLRVLQDDHWNDAEHTYEVRRFKEEKTRYLSYLAKQKWSLPDFASVKREAALMSYVSHLYLDTFNQPTQPFSPHSIYCAGQWKLWEQIGDFRLTLYTTPVITALRSELFAHELWDRVASHSAVALIQAMLVRICQQSLDKISLAIITPAMHSLQLTPLSSNEIAVAHKFLEEFESILVQLHIKHLTQYSAGLSEPGKASAENHTERELA